MIRPAEASDIPRLLEMGRDFAREAGVIERAGWNDEDATALLHQLVESPEGILFVSEGGMIGGYIAEHPFNRATRMFVEMFWRSEDGQGLALLRAAEQAAEEAGATKSVMVAMDNMERTARLYERIGYAPVEANFMKDLG